jgi:hypothetical protein
MRRFIMGTSVVVAAIGLLPATAHVTRSAAATGPRIFFSRASAPPGVSVVVHGVRFARRARVNVIFGGVVRATGTTTATGTFALTFRVPAATGGPHWVRVRDAAGHSIRKALLVTQRVLAAPQVIAPYDALCHAIGVAVPYRVTVTARGFGADAPLVVTLGGVRVRTLLSNANGSASGTFQVGPETPGLQALRVADPAHGFSRGRFLLSQTFSCWTAVSNGSGLDWRWHGVGWDGNSTVTIGIVRSSGRRIVHTATAGPRGSFGTLAFTSACPPAGTYPVTIVGRSQQRPFTIRAGTLHVFGTC